MDCPTVQEPGRIRNLLLYLLQNSGVDDTGVKLSADLRND